ncbi:hypothetical protein ASD99_22930 [Mesorhizobium sp. Root695]|nr:hypothetical protein ASD99_22930 [Mesorhizobium sp. Root695]
MAQEICAGFKVRLVAIVEIGKCDLPCSCRVKIENGQGIAGSTTAALLELSLQLSEFGIGSNGKKVRALLGFFGGQMRNALPQTSFLASPLR